MESLLPLLFSFRGRIARGRYWIGVTAAIGLGLLTLGLASTAMNPTGGGGAAILAIPLLLLFVWIFLAVATKRMRDAGLPRGLSPLYALAPLLWVATTLEFIEKLGLLVALVLIVLILLPGILPTRAPADPAEETTS